MSPFWTEAFGNPHSAEHAAGWTAMRAVERATERIASLMGANSSEVVFTSGATEANNLALQGAALSRTQNGRRRIIVGAVEHKSVMEVARHCVERGIAEVAIAPVDAAGRIDLKRFENLVDKHTLLVSVGAVNGEIGTIQPMAEIGEVVRRAGAIFHSDATQAPCAEALAPIYDAVDLISLSGHKCYGPKGIGTLLVKSEVRERIAPIMFGGGQQGGLRPGTIPPPLAVGFAEALHLAQKDLPEEAASLREKRDFLLDRLIQRCPGISLVGPAEERHPGNLNVRILGVAAHSLISAVQPRVAASTGSACSSGVEEPSHVLSAIGLSWEEAGECLRLSVGRFTLDSEIEAAVEIIIEAILRLRVI